MSRVGKKTIIVPTGVTVKFDNGYVEVKGPKGVLSWSLPLPIKMEMTGQQINLIRPTESKLHKSLHGLSRNLVNNMVVGVSNGFEKILLIAGVGYKAQMQGQNLVLQMGYSHPVTIKPPEGITFDLPEPTKIRVSGIDKKLVGETAAYIRSIRKADPYKLKGIRYLNEQIKKKAGKTGF